MTPPCAFVASANAILLRFKSTPTLGLALSRAALARRAAASSFNTPPLLPVADASDARRASPSFSRSLLSYRSPLRPVSVVVVVVVVVVSDAVPTPASLALVVAFIVRQRSTCMATRATCTDLSHTGQAARRLPDTRIVTSFVITFYPAAVVVVVVVVVSAASVTGVSRSSALAVSGKFEISM
jgi:hypothetical protein